MLRLWCTGSLVVLALAAPVADADVYGYRVNVLRGAVYKRDGDLAKEALSGIEADYAAEPTDEHTLDLAQARILMEQYDEALNLLLALEQRLPGNGEVTATLSLAYEHLGMDA